MPDIDFSKPLAIGRGINYLDVWDSNGKRTGYVDLGECPQNNMSIEPETSEYQSSRSGLSEVIATDLVAIRRRFELQLSGITPFALALFVQGGISQITQAAAAVTDEVIRLKQGTYGVVGYSGSGKGIIGAMTSVAVRGNPSTATTNWATGVSKTVGDYVIPSTPNGYWYTALNSGTTDGVTEPTWPTTIGDTVVDNDITWECSGVVATYVADTDYEVGTNGKIYAIEGGSISATGQDVYVDYTPEAKGTVEVVTAQALQTVVGSYRFEGNNPRGPSYNIEVPKCNVIPSGSASWITEGGNYQGLGITVEVVKLDDSTPPFYVNGLPIWT